LLVFVVCVLPFAWLVATFGERYYLAGPLDDFDLLVLSGIGTAVSLALVALVGESRWRSISEGGVGVQVRRWVLWVVLGLGVIVSVPVLWFALVASSIGQYTSLGVIGEHEYVVREATFDETGLSVYERHGLEIKPVRIAGTTMTGGTPFQDGDFAVERGTDAVVVTIPHGELTFTPSRDMQLPDS
jgi:hypothetical protein